MINEGMFTSNTPEWETPQDFFDKLDAEFNFMLDACATVDNTKCDSWYSPTIDGLSQLWPSCPIWMNPPYGRTIGKWVKKAYEASLNGSTVVCLVPARTDTAWWHDFCVKGEIRFIRGRLKFGGHKWNAPFPSAIVIFAVKAKSEEAGG